MSDADDDFAEVACLFHVSQGVGKFGEGEDAIDNRLESRLSDRAVHRVEHAPRADEDAA